MKFLIFYILLSWTFSVAAQSPILWEKSFGGTMDDDVHDIIQLSNGDYIFCGSTLSNNVDVSGNHGGRDAWVCRISSLGDLIWQKCIGGSDEDFFTSLIPSFDGNIVLCGATASSDGDVSGNNGMLDLWIVKITPTGNIIWELTYGGSDYDSGQSILELASDSSLVIAGNSRSSDGDVSNNQGVDDVWIVKLDSIGNLLWEKNYGSSDSDNAYSIVETGNNFFVTAWSGTTNGDVNGGYGSDYWVLKLDENGDLLWNFAYGSLTTDQAFGGGKLAPDGGFFCLGQTPTTYANGDISDPINVGTLKSDVWALKLDVFGQIEWEKCLGGLENDIFPIFEVVPDGYIVVMQTSSSDQYVYGPSYGGTDAWMIKLDFAGNIVWQYRLGGSSNEETALTQIINTQDGSPILAIESKSSDIDLSSNYGDFDIWIVKFGVNLGLIEQKEVEIEIYPNPTKDYLNIKSQFEINQIQLFNMLGQEMELGDINGTQLDLSHLPNGTYFLKVHTNQNIRTIKILKQ